MEKHEVNGNPDLLDQRATTAGIPRRLQDYWATLGQWLLNSETLATLDHLRLKPLEAWNINLFLCLFVSFSPGNQRSLHQFVALRTLPMCL